MPIADMQAHARGLARIGPLALGLLQPRDLAFRELYFLESARKIRREVSMPLALVGGVKSLAAARQVIDEGCVLKAPNDPTLARRPVAD